MVFVVGCVLFAVRCKSLFCVVVDGCLRCVVRCCCVVCVTGGCCVVICCSLVVVCCRLLVLWFVVRRYCSLFVVCCLLFADRCSLRFFVACYNVGLCVVVSCSLCVVCCPLRDAGCLLFVVRFVGCSS